MAAAGLGDSDIGTLPATLDMHILEGWLLFWFVLRSASHLSLFSGDSLARLVAADASGEVLLRAAESSFTPIEGGKIDKFNFVHKKITHFQHTFAT